MPADSAKGNTRSLSKSYLIKKAEDCVQTLASQYGKGQACLQEEQAKTTLNLTDDNFLPVMSILQGFGVITAHPDAGRQYHSITIEPKAVELAYKDLIEGWQKSFRRHPVWAGISPPYTFFLLNDDMELNRNRQILI